MKKKNLLSLSVLLGAGVLALAACGGGSTGGGDIDPTLPTDDPTSEVEIQFWHCMGHNRTDQVQKIVDTFNAEYAGKYRVTLVSVAGSYDDLDDSVRTRLAAGEVPALTMAYPDSIAQYITDDTYDSAVYRLDNYIADATYGYSQEEIDDFVDAFYAEGQSYQFEGVWSMPFYKSTEIMYYNDNYFHGINAQTQAVLGSNAEYVALSAAVEAAGKSPTSEDLEALKTFVSANGGYVYEVPATWDDMVTVGRKMISDRAAQNIQDDFFPFGYDSDANLMISQMAQRDIPYTTNENVSNPEDHFVFDNDQTNALLTEITDLIKEKVMVTGETSGEGYTNTLFTEGETAMTVGSTGGSSYNVSSNFKVSLAPVPYKGNQRYIMQGPSICFFIQNDPYVQKGAWLFYKAMAETEANTQLALESSYDPVRESCYETESYQNFIALHESDLKYDVPYHTRDLRQYYMTSDVFIGSDTARDEMDAIIGQVVAAGLTVEAAITQAYNNCRAAVI